MTNIKEKVERIEQHHKFNKMQKEIDVLYEKEGLTDTVLEKQVELNTLRHKTNIPDDNEKIYKQYVQ